MHGKVRLPTLILKQWKILLKYVITYFISTLQVQNLQVPAKIGIFTCTMYMYVISYNKYVSFCICNSATVTLVQFFFKKLKKVFTRTIMSESR